MWFFLGCCATAFARGSTCRVVRISPPPLWLLWKGTRNQGCKFRSERNPVRSLSSSFALLLHSMSCMTVPSFSASLSLFYIISGSNAQSGLKVGTLDTSASSYHHGYSVSVHHSFELIFLHHKLSVFVNPPTYPFTVSLITARTLDMKKSELIIA